MKTSGVVLLNDEAVPVALLYFTGRLRSFVESSLLLIFFEAHPESNL